MASRKVRSRWLMNNNRKSLAHVRIAGLNLQGKPQKSSMSIFSFGRELQTTIFIVQFSIGSYRWTISKSFDELREFHNMILTDSTLRSGREYFTLPFPIGKDGETDTMVLVERREMIEALLKEVLNVLDFEVYEPLYLFMEAEPHVLHLGKSVKIITKLMRSQLAKKRLNQRLFRFYSQELINFMYTMEAGIEVYNIDEHNNGEPEVFMLWLDVCDEPALSRICLAPKEIYSLPKAYEDERLANGIFLSDIAEVRKGAASHAFRSYPFTQLLRPELCVCIVGSERTLSVQFIHERLPEAAIPASMNDIANQIHDPDTNNNSRAMSPLPTPSTPAAPEKKKMIVDRAYFIDMLNLMAIQSLTPNELKLRQRKFTRASPHSAVKVYPNHILSPKVRDNAAKLLKLLVAGIEVDEETFSPYLGIRIYQKNLQYDPNSRKLMINSTAPNTATDTTTSSSSSPTPISAPTPVEGVGVSEQEKARAVAGGSISPLLLPLSTVGVVVGKELQDIAEAENEDEDEEEDNNGHRDNHDDDADDADGEEEEDEEEEEGEEERTSSSSQSSVSQRNTMESLHNSDFLNPPAISNPSTIHPNLPTVMTSSTPQNIDLSHLKFDLTTQNRSIDLDDVCEIRPGKVSPLIDGCNVEDNDSLYVSIIASESILVLPVPSLVVRNNLIKRFQALLMVHRDYAGLDCDTPAVFRKKASSLASPRFNRVVASSLPPIPPGTLLTFNSPQIQSQSRKTTSSSSKQKKSSKKSKKSSKSSSKPIPIASHSNHNNNNTNPNTPVQQTSASSLSPSSSLTGTPGAHILGSSPSNPSIPNNASTASKRRRSAPSVTLTAQLAQAQLNNRHIYSHTKQTRSVSIVRRSSNSSKGGGQSSISESFHTAIGNSRTTSLDLY